MSPVQANIDGLQGEGDGHGLFDTALGDFLAADRDGKGATLAYAASVIVELEAKLALALWQLFLSFGLVDRAEPVVPNRRFAVLEIEAHPGRAAAVGEDHAVGFTFGRINGDRKSVV